MAPSWVLWLWCLLCVCSQRLRPGAGVAGPQARHGLAARSPGGRWWGPSPLPGLCQGAMRPRHSRLESERLTAWLREAAEWALTRGCRARGGEPLRTRAQGPARDHRGRLVVLEEERPGILRCSPRSEPLKEGLGALGPERLAGCPHEGPCVRPGRLCALRSAGRGTAAPSSCGRAGSGPRASSPHLQSFRGVWPAPRVRGTPDAPLQPCRILAGPPPTPAAESPHRRLRISL